MSSEGKTNQPLILLLILGIKMNIKKNADIKV